MASASKKNPGASEPDPQALWLAEERTRLLVDSIQDYSILMLDRDGVVLTWNAGAERIHGHAAEEMVGRHFSLLYPEGEVAGGVCEREISQAWHTGRHEGDVSCLRRDGTRFWAHVTVSAIWDPSGEMLGFSHVTRDLTRERETVEALRRSEERFRLLLEGIEGYAIFMLDTRGYVTSWHVGAEKIKGYQSEEIIGRHFSRFYPPEDIVSGRYAKGLQTALQTGSYEEEGWRVRKDGSRFWASVVITALRDPTGEHVGFAKITRDLTEPRRAEEERLRLARANEAIRMRDEFLWIASHELKTPLTALQLQLVRLRHLADGADVVADSTERAIRSGERMANLIDTLLDISRITLGKLSLSLERVDLGRLAAEIVERERDIAQAAGCDISLHVDARVEGSWDRVRIGQAMAQILSNAIKYGAGKPIRVAIRLAGGNAVLEVTDEGPGLSDSTLPRIFERFQRNAPITKQGGLGLGLYVARQIVAAHGGSLTAGNLPTGGASFTVRLPLGPGYPAELEPHGWPEEKA